MRAFLPTLLLSVALPAFAFAQMDHSQMDHSQMQNMDHMDMQMEMSPAQTEATPPDTPTSLVPTTTEDSMAAMPGMDHSAHGGAHDMTPIDPKTLPQAAPDRLGATELASEVKDGVREFHLSASMIGWPITDDVTVAAMAYNGQVPGPTIRVHQGEKIRVVFTNNLAEPTTIHWHGMDVPIEMDGVPGVSQEPVKPGESFTYEFTVTNAPGTFFYHTHVMPDKQQALGLYGAFIVDPKEGERKAYTQDYTLLLGEWTVKDGGNIPSMPMEGMFPNYFTINGKAWPNTQHITAKVGDKILLRVIGSGSFAHPVHLHGAPFTVVATDGHPVPAAAQLTKDTLEVAPGERYDLLWTPTRPGTWLLHCHINHHTMNNGVGDDATGMGGMALAIDVAP